MESDLTDLEHREEAFPSERFRQNVVHSAGIVGYDVVWFRGAGLETMGVRWSNWRMSDVAETPSSLGMTVS